MTTPTICATHPLRYGALAIVQTQRAYHVVYCYGEGQVEPLTTAEFWTFEAAHERMENEAARQEAIMPVGSHVRTVCDTSWRMAREL